MSTFNLIAHLHGLLVEELELNDKLDYFANFGVEVEDCTAFARLQAVKHELAEHAGTPAAEAAFNAFITG